MVIGNRVEIIEHPNKEYVGKQGKIIYVGSTIKSVTQPIKDKLPKRQTAPYYGVVLDDGREVQNLKENQLRKL